MTSCSITRKAKTWKIILPGLKIVKRSYLTLTNQVALYLWNNEKSLPRKWLISKIRIFAEDKAHIPAIYLVNTDFLNQFSPLILLPLDKA